eukprot:scaffold1283_cov364-Pavlova_lutheri.AAC.3
MDGRKFPGLEFPSAAKDGSSISLQSSTELDLLDLNGRSTFNIHSMVICSSLSFINISMILWRPVLGTEIRMYIAIATVDAAQVLASWV